MMKKALVVCSVPTSREYLKERVGEVYGEVDLVKERVDELPRGYDLYLIHLRDVVDWRDQVKKLRGDEPLARVIGISGRTGEVGESFDQFIKSYNVVREISDLIFYGKL